jgi:hypothetical protein
MAERTAACKLKSGAGVGAGQFLGGRFPVWRFLNLNPNLNLNLFFAE